MLTLPCHGALKDAHDPRDFTFAQHGRVGTATPGTPSLLAYRAPTFLQGPVQSCVAASLAKALWMGEHIEGVAAPDFASVAWLYWIARAAERSITPVAERQPLTDSGCFPRLMFRAAQNMGVVSALAYPYDTTSINEAPPIETDRAAYDCRGLRYYRCDGTGDALIEEIGQALSLRYPVIVSMAVDHDFMTHQGPEPVTTYDPKARVGGHAMVVLAVEGDTLVCDNHWGQPWDPDGLRRVKASVVAEAAYDVYALSAPPPRRDAA